MYIKTAQFILLLIVSPFLFGVINRVKAFFAGRKGIPLLQMYYDILKLLRKGAVYSPTTTWLFIAGPILSFSSVLLASMILPVAGYSSFISFEGDLVLFLYLFGLARFFTVLAALDTGSSFEGMGASREVQFAVFAEPALFLSLAALSCVSGKTSLTDIFSNLSIVSFSAIEPVIILIAVAVFIILLAENSRIPVDDPNTHLELTMIHEVMVLDHGGFDFAFILYGSAIKFWVLGTFLVSIIFRINTGNIFLNYLLFTAGMILLAIIVGIIESVLARLRLIKVPNLLIAALSLSVVAFSLAMR